jgi:hypothetical protein
MVEDASNQSESGEESLGKGGRISQQTWISPKRSATFNAA